jgi:hypothetical protein
MFDLFPTRAGTPDEILDELRRWPGWRLWYPELDDLAERVAAVGGLTESFDTACRKWAGTPSHLSLSSGLGADGDHQVFLLLLRHEFLNALSWPDEECGGPWSKNSC